MKSSAGMTAQWFHDSPSAWREMWGDMGEIAPAGAERRGAQRGRPIETRGETRGSLGGASGETWGRVRSLPGAVPNLPISPRISPPLDAGGRSHLGSISARVQQDVTGRHLGQVSARSRRRSHRAEATRRVQLSPP